MNSLVTANPDHNKIESHERYDLNQAPDFEKSDCIIFVLTGQENQPKDFLKNFKEYYKERYNNKKLVFLHSDGSHWTTYECDYKYESGKEPDIKRHEITGDGRCGLHAVAKALAIVTEKNDLVETKVLHGITHFQVPAAIGTGGDKIFDHLGLNQANLANIKIEAKKFKERIVEPETNLAKRIDELNAQSRPEDWLSSEDIENILLKTSIRSKSGVRICLASQNEPFNILPGGKEKRWNAEILSIILDSKYWQDDKCTKSFENFPQDKKQYFETFLYSGGARNQSLKTQLERFKGFRYSKENQGKIKVTSAIDEFNHIDTFQEKEKFCRFVFENIGSSWLDKDAKVLIHQTLMFLKINNMVSGNSQSDKHIYSTCISAEDRIARNDLYDELLKFYPLSGQPEKIDDSKKSMINSFLRQAFTDGIEMKSGSKIKISDDGAVRIKGGKTEECKINKINSVNFTDRDEEKLKSRRFLQITDDKGLAKVVKVNSKESEIEFEEIQFGQTSPEIALYSEYVRYAEENKGEESDFFSLQPQKFKGYGLKIRLDNNKLYFEECFNDDYRSILNGKENLKITKINDENLQTHLTRAKTLGIEPKYYINSLFRAQDSDIKLTFDDGDVNLIKDSKMTFEKKDDGSYLVSHDNIDIEQRKTEIDKLMILGKKVTFEARQVKSAQSPVKGSNVRFRADDVQASSASPENATRAIKGIKDASKFQDLISSNVHFDWWFVNDFNNENATGGECKYSAEDKKSLLGNKDYLNNSLDLANNYFEQLLASESGTTIYGIRLIKIYNYLTILQDNKQNESSSLLASDQELGNKLEKAIKNLEHAIEKKYKNNHGDKGVLDHDGLTKNVNNLIGLEAKNNRYHNILKERAEARPSPSPSVIGIDDKSRGRRETDM
ncbi:MAG: hypothetical protein ACO201_02590 [Rickettsiales bacterium]